MVIRLLSSGGQRVVEDEIGVIISQLLLLLITLVKGVRLLHLMVLIHRASFIVIRLHIYLRCTSTSDA